MNRQKLLLDQIKMYSVLVGQQEDVLYAIDQMGHLGAETHLARQASATKQMIAENKAEIKKFQEEYEKLEGAG